MVGHCVRGDVDPLEAGAYMADVMCEAATHSDTQRASSHAAGTLGHTERRSAGHTSTFPRSAGFKIPPVL